MRIIVAGLIVLGLCSAARADVRAELRYGHGGRAVAGALTQVVVRITSLETEALTVRITGGIPDRILPGEQSRISGYLAPGGQKDFTLFVRPPEQGYVELELSFDRAVTLDAGGRTLRSPARVHVLSGRQENPAYEEDAQSHLQVLAVGRQAGSLPDSDRVRVMPVTADYLPQVWHAYDSLDAVYWRNPSDAKDLEPARLEALIRWVRQGGRLVISETRRVDLLSDGALGELLPADLGTALSQDDYKPIAATLAGGKVGEDDGTFAAAGPLVRLTPRDGEVLLATAEGPLMVQARRGLGVVVLLAFDPARLGGAKEKLAAGLYMTLVGEGPYVGPDEEEDFPTSNWSGYEDRPRQYFSGILRVLRTGAVKAPPMMLLSLFMLLYILAVGPGDYFFLKKKKLLKYSALSFLALAIVFSATAYFVSFHLFSGGARVNRITLVDIVPEGEEEAVFINDYSGFYAPRGAEIDLSVGAETSAFSQLLRPTDFSGGGGGLATEPLHLDLAAPARPVGAISIPFRSLRTVRTVAYRRTVLPLDASFDAGGALHATNGFPFRLRDAVLVGPEGIQHLGGIEPGEAIDAVYNPQDFAGDRFRHQLGKTGLPDASGLEFEVDDTDDLTVSQKSRIARAFQALSVGGTLEFGDSRLFSGRRRLLEKWAIDRSPSVERGTVLLIAWTDARDPFSLPGGEEEGFSVTILRKVVER